MKTLNSFKNIASNINDWIVDFDMHIRGTDNSSAIEYKFLKKFSTIKTKRILRN